MNTMHHPIVGRIVQLFNERGNGRYGSEAVSQMQHAIQCALLAIRAGAESPLVAAALLHDIGHILDDHELPESDEQNLDDLHEQRAYAWLRENFGRAVADPVRLHVVAKRFLCTTEPEYVNTLSPTSLKSYHDQGGLMSQSEIDDFRDEPFAFEAVQLRRWDDLAKDPNLEIPAIEDFMPLLEQLILSPA